MRIVSFEQDGRWEAGLSVGGIIFSVNHLLERCGEAPVASTRELLCREGAALPGLSQRLLSAASTAQGAAVGDTREVRLGPPVSDCEKVLCIGLNYNDHVAETGRALPTHPDVFAKFASTLIGPSDEIDCSSVTDNLDFEGELALVIGRPCRNVSPDRALDHVAGLMVLNDITARDLQYRGTQWLAGKAVDRSTPCGPELVTLDEIGDPHDLDIRTWVNGVEMQSSNTRHMIFTIEALISYVSGFLQLNPGDIISTGTPQGIGAKRTPPVWLRAGDIVEVELQHVGRLRNRIR